MGHLETSQNLPNVFICELVLVLCESILHTIDQLELDEASGELVLQVTRLVGQELLRQGGFKAKT